MMDLESLYRGWFLLILVLTLSISAYFRRRARESGDVLPRRQEGLTALMLRMAAAIPLFVTLILYVVHPRALAWSELPLPAWLRSLASLLAVLCVLCIVWVFRSIGRNISETVLTKSDHELVTQGPYRWIRHPLYASTLLLLFALGLVASNWFILSYTLAALVVFRVFVIPAEEAYLVAKFEDKYKDYQQRTGALIPRLF